MLVPAGRAFPISFGFLRRRSAAEGCTGRRGAKKGEGKRATPGGVEGERATVVEGKQSTNAGWGFVTVGGVGFEGEFGVGCADSSTLSSAPRSTGGYALLHTFTGARTPLSRTCVHSNVSSFFLSVYVRLVFVSYTRVPAHTDHTRTHRGEHTRGVCDEFLSLSRAHSFSFRSSGRSCARVSRHIV